MRAAGVLVGLALLALACGGGGFRPLAAGDPAPDYAAATLAGDTVALAALKGRAVLVNVWATWCPPCREEMPALDRLRDEAGPRGLEVLAISIDAGGDRGAIEEFVAARALGLTILHDPARRVERAFRTIGVPESFLIDREGRIVRRWVGQFDPSSPEARAAVAEALGETVPEAAPAGAAAPPAT